MTICIGDFAFATKQSATAEIRRILHAYPHGTVLSGADGDLIIALVGLHPRADEKIGAGIEFIDVRRMDRGAPGFWINRIDGTCEDFSYKRCLDGDLSHRASVLRAMRSSVEDQVLAYRRAAFATDPVPVCPLTGMVLANDQTTHVDHDEIDFADLAEVYANTVGGYDSISLVPNTIHPGPRLMSPHAELFPEYHRCIARLRLLHRSANLARARR
jgi:hypothetical protein